MNILVVDVGTSSMRGILFDRTGTKRETVQMNYHPTYKERGVVEQTASELEAALCRVISDIVKLATARADKIDMIALTSQRSSVTAVDKEGTPLLPFIMWQDVRNQAICERLREADKEIFERSGTYVNTVFAGGKMAWILEQQISLRDKIFKFTTISEYLIHVMTGNFCTDHTYGSRTNLMNLRERKWDPVLLQLFGIKEEQLCHLIPPGSMAGAVTKEFAARTGLTQGTPVISAGGDQQCAALGMGVYGEGKISIVTGTGAFLMTVCDQMPENLKGDVICNASALQGQYTLEASVLTCCSAFDWFKRNFYGDTVGFDDIGRILQEQYQKDTSCLVLPYFQGRAAPEWDETIRASFHNLSLATTKDELLGALLYGIFMEIRNSIDSMENYVLVKEGFISGGLTQSRIINQMQADVYGISLYHMQDCESTANGAAISALVGQKIIPDAGEAFQKLCGGMEMERIAPDEVKHHFHYKALQEMRRLYKEEKSWKKRDGI